MKSCNIKSFLFQKIIKPSRVKSYYNKTLITIKFGNFRA